MESFTLKKFIQVIVRGPPFQRPKKAQHVQDLKAPRENFFPCGFEEAFFFSKMDSAGKKPTKVTLICKKRSQVPLGW